MSMIPLERQLQYYNYECQNTKCVETKLAGENEFNVLSSVIGELSDGIWEESFSAEKYWRFCSVVLNPTTNRVEIRISNLHSTRSSGWHRVVWNPFLSMSDSEIRLWFSRKIKRIFNIECHDKNIKISFNKKNDQIMEYFGFGEPVSTIVEVYNKIKY